ncbi:hypothetical protein IFM89_038222 [Coptis chinensis]|uniref:LOB domain-containing protein n=1 Tax=Coptis chinensis TaxID=261450 RepID=A0A835M610_9MAGN|nr:hypothetical protein IFM89_038222 [Coptis chinensis]
MNVPRNSNSGTQACAACKYQRRKCQPDCTLAPYFPPTHQTQFLNVHKLFGVSNILKVLRSLNSRYEKDEAMQSMIYEADARGKDPVGGSHMIIRNFHHQIACYQSELELVLHQLARCREQVQMNEEKMDVPLFVSPDQYEEQMTPFFINDSPNQGYTSLVLQESDPIMISPAADGSCSSSFIGMFDQALALECRVSIAKEFNKELGSWGLNKIIDGEETEDLVLREETVPQENFPEHELKEVVSQFTLTNC